MIKDFCKPSKFHLLPDVNIDLDSLDRNVSGSAFDDVQEGIWGTWRHMAITYDGNDTRLFIDGQEHSRGQNIFMSNEEEVDAVTKKEAAHPRFVGHEQIANRASSEDALNMWLRFDSPSEEDKKEARHNTLSWDNVKSRQPIFSIAKEDYDAVNDTININNVIYPAEDFIKDNVNGAGADKELTFYKILKDKGSLGFSMWFGAKS